MKISEKETIELLDEFINENGLWHSFLEYVDTRGISKEDLNMETE